MSTAEYNIALRGDGAVRTASHGVGAAGRSVRPTGSVGRAHLEVVQPDLTLT